MRLVCLQLEVRLIKMLLRDRQTKKESRTSSNSKEPIKEGEEATSNKISSNITIWVEVATLKILLRVFEQPEGDNKEAINNILLNKQTLLDNSNNNNKTK